MTKIRYGFSVRVESVEHEPDKTTIVRLDFGNSCYGSFTLPSANVAVGKRVMIYMEIDNAEPIQSDSETANKDTPHGGQRNG